MDQPPPDPVEEGDASFGRQRATPLSYDAAKAIARRYLDDMGGDYVVELSPWPMVRSYGWVFFYDSRDYLETGDPRHALFGNAPFLVNRHTGAVVTFGTALRTEDYLIAYEREGLDGYASNRLSTESAPDLFGTDAQAAPPPSAPDPNPGEQALVVALTSVPPNVTDAQVIEVADTIRRNCPQVWQQATSPEQPGYDGLALGGAIRSLRARWSFVMQSPVPLWILAELDWRVRDIARQEHERREAIREP